MKRALITGISGQDGRILGQQLLEQGYQVIGVSRGEAHHFGQHPQGNQYVHHALELGGEGVHLQSLSLGEVDEVYHFAGESFVPRAEQNPEKAFLNNVVASEVLLREVFAQNPEARVFLASSAAIFAQSGQSPQNEQSPMGANNIYGLTKLCLRELGKLWRSKGRFVTTGILYNHESRYRPEQFVTKKITKAAQAIAAGKQDKLELGNLETMRDWSYAGDFMCLAQATLHLEEPEDFIFASGKGRSIAEFCQAAFAQVNLNYLDFVVSVEAFYRSSEEYPLIGNDESLREKTGNSQRMSFADLVKEIGMDG